MLVVSYLIRDDPRLYEEYFNSYYEAFYFYDHINTLSNVIDCYLFLCQCGKSELIK